MTKLGAIEFSSSSYNSMELSVKVAGLAALPFVFASHKEAMDAMSGPFGKALRAAVERSGLYVFDTSFDMGFKQIANAVRPVSVPSDLRGLRIRSVSSAVEIAMFKALGASPVPVDAAQTYTAAQTHLIDGVDFPLAVIDGYKIYEVQKYLSIVNWGWTGIIQTANPEAWRKLPASLQAIVERNLSATGAIAEDDIVKLDGAMTGMLAAKGMTVSQVDVAAFKEPLKRAGLYAEWRGLYGAPTFDLLQAAVGRLI